MGLAVMMGVQTPAMAAETSQESTTQETVLEPQTEEGETVQVEIAESQAEEIETTQVEIAESQAEEIETTQVENVESQAAEAESEQTDTTELQSEEVNETETQTEETAISTENAESQVEEASEQVGQAEQETEAEVAVLEAAEEDGWHQNDDGSRYYVKDGEILKGCVEKIDDSYYGFNWNGVMYADDDFSIWNEETQMADFYRAKADGSLYVNEWYIPGEWSKCYYGADGKQYNGLHTIDGKQYYFSESGWLCTNQNVSARDGKYYFCDEEGIATEQTLANNDWTEIDGKRYYVKDGELLKSCVEKIGDFYYGFDYNAVLYADSEFSIWDQETQKQNYYRAKADGSLYANEWYIYNEWNKYYYGEEGRACSGLQIIEGKQYYFSEWGGLYTDTIVAAEDGKYYFCDEDGVAIERTLANNAWTEVDGKYYYVKDGTLLRNCIEKIGDFYYGFKSNGAMYADEYFSCWNEENQISDFYRAKADGTLYVNEWYVADDSNENPYYYGANGKAYVGLKEVDGILYCFKYNGERYQNTTATVDGKSYYCDVDGTVTELSEGWNQINGKRMYIKDGAFVSNCVLKIDDNYYGFDYSGNLYTDTSFSIWDAEMGGYVNYRAKADGSLYVNEWFSQLYTIGYRKHYYGADGKLVYGLQTIDGKQYYFDTNGMLAFDAAFSVDGKTYYSASDGTVTELNNEGWNKIGEDYLYIKDGQILKNCVVQINDAYYGFSDKGIMYSDTTFAIWDEHYVNRGYYWASPSGALYTNAWGGEYFRIRYYGADGKACKGMQTIDGIRYAFDENKDLILSDIITSDGVNYYSDAEGRIDEMPNNQWYKGDNGSWYYVKDGTLLKGCTIQIGENWYKFDSTGKMQTQGLNVNADGSLRVNTWFYDGTYWHYYGADGQSYQTGIYEIAGVNYYFTDGNMATSSIVNANGKLYVADENGYLTQIPETGWIQVGNDYYYAENSNLIKNSIRKIDGAHYAFDDNGKMFADGEYVCNQVTCRAHTNGSLYVSQWYQDANGSWYYYGANAKRVSGEAEVNGIPYLFNSAGILKINGVIQKGGNYYLADGNGIWVRTSGWVYQDGSWYYVRNDGSLYQGILKDGGYTYYMNPRMVTDSERKVMDGIVYNIDASGHVSVASDGFYHSGLLNHLYYISDGKSAEKGWKEIDGNQYYFRDSDSDGMYWAVSDGIYDIENKYYRFNSDGTLASAGWYLDSDGSWYYVDESGAVATGDTLINGTLYRFANNGRLKTGVIVEDGKCNLYNDDGVLIETGAAQGWNLLGGNYYYLRGNEILTGGNYKLPDGKWYTFDGYGRMRTNILEGCWYGESGAAQTGWFMADGKWYYASEINGRVYTGLNVINGVEYYFDDTGVMQTGQVVVEDKLLTINDSGAIVAISAMQDGWSHYDEQWYYYQNAKPYTGWVGAYYVSDGKMLCNATVTWNGKVYRLGEDGAYLTNTWYSVEYDGNYYVKADGSQARNEWLELDRKMYYFDSKGRSVQYINKDVLTENGVYGADGVYLSADGYAQGWSLIDGTYYYKDGENFVINQAKKINGDWYLFDVHGKMVTGFSASESYFDIGWSRYDYDDGKFYYGSDGRRCYYIGWRVIDGKWYYFDTESQAASGWQIINGVRYYFDTKSHVMATGYYVVAGSLYYFDVNGACQGIERGYVGWHLDDSGNWYYIRNGHAVTRTTVIDGVMYEFDGYGVWNLKS